MRSEVRIKTDEDDDNDGIATLAFELHAINAALERIADALETIEGGLASSGAVRVYIEG